MTDNGEAGVRWFYVQEGRRKGPLGVAELVALILGGAVPEDTLIWRAGLGEWVKANSVEEIQRELPPPIPNPDSGPLGQGGAPSREATLAEELDEGEGESEQTGPVGTNPSGGSARLGSRRRRRHRTRLRLAATRRRWLVPFLVMLFVVVVVLWYLLRRFNEVPPGQVILQGALSSAPGRYQRAIT